MSDSNPLLGFVKDIEAQMETRHKGVRSSEEQDQVVRSIKKVKPCSTEEEPMCQEEDMSQCILAETGTDAVTSPKVVSFRDMVLESGTQGVHDDHTLELSNEDILRLVTEELGSDLKQFNEEDMPPAPFIPKLEAKVTLEEYETWCEPWQRTLNPSSSACWGRRSV